MTESMIERVARALADTTHAGYESWDDVPQEMQTSFLIDARTAIEAMRKPTDTMLTAALFAMDTEDDSGGVISCWEAMIDAARNEQVPG
ncbi:hypothetical protein [Manganibacter manganicus]|uniref:Uncharacterized protein n=1 Tax=Manganibacter manganicus TaxID=1873176 RepID=A0A1V8RP44_9HYPH|nr:hypothetical protein [Pseudaminobacter manganicus]OQM74938.1 hypothetical protein BFN67_04805 [Pseudaminobacter manganicus]